MARVRSIASGSMRPVRSTPYPSRTISIRRSTSVSAPVSRSTSATSSRMELVPQSTAPTRTSRPESAIRRLEGGRRAAGRLPPVVELLQHLVAEHVDARPPGERVRGENVQALDPVGHPSSGDPGDLLDVAELAAVGEVVVVC